MELNETKILFGRYCIRLKNESEDIVSFDEIKVCNLKTSTEICSHLNFPSCSKGKILVLDECLLVIREEDYPRFAIVINDCLTEISANTAEQILRLKKLNLSKRRQELLNQFWHQCQWENHNGVLINPDTLSVPGMLNILLWIEKRNIHLSKSSLKNFDIKFLCTILTCKENKKQAVAYIKS